MSVKINSKYLENYAIEFSKKVCDQYFSSKKYMTGTEILSLTPSKQVNFFVIKSLFEAWHSELEKLKSNPYFDYRDNNVHRALSEFMNVLSRSIKIDRVNFEPLLGEAVAFSILVALEPLSFFKNEFASSFLTIVFSLNLMICPFALSREGIKVEVVFFIMVLFYSFLIFNQLNLLK